MNPEPPASPFFEVPWWRSFVFRVVGLFAGTVVGLVVLAVIWLYRAESEDVQRSLGMSLQAAAATAAPQISAAEVFAIEGDPDPASASFRRVRRVLAQVRAANRLEEDEVYVLRPDPEEEGAYRFVAMLQARTFIGDRYQPPPQLAQLYRRVIDRERAGHSRLYTDENGSFVSGVAPIRDPTGRTVALLQVDRDLALVMRTVEERCAALIYGGVLLIALILLAGVWTHRRLRAQTAELLGGTRAIEREDYGHRVPVTGKDELAAVALALNSALAQLKERFEMLKFLPLHTRRMIRDRLEEGVRLDTARKVRVAVLESDIRGFSSMSESLSPESTIAMLNHYIRVQAEIVTAAGGSIDKYMGDAVLAIFEGEGMERRALECAAAIQRTVRQMNEDGVLEHPIHIGVGLHVGDAVMGNMGSEERMEHTVIGATVNLAARLCSLAGKGEVVCSGELWRAAGAPEELGSTSREEAQVKGFESAVAIVRLTPSPRPRDA